MMFAAVVGHCFGRATPSLRNAPHGKRWSYFAGKPSIGTETLFRPSRPPLGLSFGVEPGRRQREPLGPVDKPDPDTTASEQDKAQEAACGLVVSGGDTALFFEMADEAFDA
jgi:hypothetical protein